MSNKSPATAKFTLGDVVRVRPGVNDPDFPDIPIGGWEGKIAEIENGNPPIYLIRWNQQTLACIHPIYRKRCERDGLDFEEMRLGEVDLEPDTGDPTILEQPTRIVTPPLSMKDQDDRIRMVFGLSRDDILPEADEANLRTYFRYLAANLKFPFEATWFRRIGFKGETGTVTIQRLCCFEDDPCWVDDSYGIICQATMDRRRIDLPLDLLDKIKGNPNRQLVQDYSYWFGNHQ